MRAVSAHTANKDRANTWHDAYGVWFAGSFRTAVQAKHGDQSWVYLDENPGKLQDGEYPVDVWGREGLLIFWKAQGFARGVVVSAEETELIEAVREVAKAKPWDPTPIFLLFVSPARPST